MFSLPVSFRCLAREILSIPSTETACERLFSALSRTTDKSMSNIQPKTVNARLMVKFDTIFERAGKINMSDICNDPKTVLKG